MFVPILRMAGHLWWQCGCGMDDLQIHQLSVQKPKCFSMYVMQNTSFLASDNNEPPPRCPVMHRACISDIARAWVTPTVLQDAYSYQGVNLTSEPTWRCTRPRVGVLKQCGVCMVVPSWSSHTRSSCTCRRFEKSNVEFESSPLAMLPSCDSCFKHLEHV